MCYFKNATVKSDKRILKKDGIIAYKRMLVYNTNPRLFYSESKNTALWRNGKMSAYFFGSKMRKIPNGRGAGVYAFKRQPYNPYFGTVIVEVLLYGRVIEYASCHRKDVLRSEAGYMAERAEIIRVVE